MQDVCDLLRFLFSSLYYYLSNKSIHFGQILIFCGKFMYYSQFSSITLMQQYKDGHRIILLRGGTYNCNPELENDNILFVDFWGFRAGGSADIHFVKGIFSVDVLYPFVK